MNVKFISATPKGEELIAYCARVSSPNQENPDIKGLLKYCLEHKHFSIFEQAHLTVEIITSRAIGRQILRHKSFSFQEFSQRYATSILMEPVEARKQAVKNRQSSTDDLKKHLKDWFAHTQNELFLNAVEAYEDAISFGIAKECARFLLPESIKTKMYMTGSVRSWIHYLQLRTQEDTQFEHRAIALAIRDDIFSQHFPVIAGLL